MRIGISGAHSTGKTTLLEALKKMPRFSNYHFGSGMTRRVRDYGCAINENGTDLTQKLIMQEHIVNVFMHDNLVGDRTALDVVVYTDVLARSGAISSKTLTGAVNVFERIMPHYDILFYIKPEFEIVDDGVRTTDIAFRDKIVDKFDEYIKQYDIRVVELTGSVDDRVAQILRAISEIE